MLKVDHFLKNGDDDFGLDGFDYNLVHFVEPCFFHVLRLCVSGTGDYHGLLDLVVFVELPYAFSGVITILNGHAAVHEDQAIMAAESTCILHDVESVSAVRCLIYYICDFEITYF